MASSNVHEAAATPTPTRVWADSTARWILTGIILIQFFPLPVVPGVGVAPNNFIFLAAILFCGSRLSRLGFRAGRISAVALFMVAFALLDWAHDFLRGGLIVNPARHFRSVIYLLLIVEVCSYHASRQRVMKLLVWVGVAQVVFGSLVYFVGQPFASIREWMLQSAESGETLIGQGSQIASLYGAPHVFSYLLASFPFLAACLYLREKKLVWLAALVVLVLGLFLNAERSSAAVFFVGVLYLVMKTPQRARNLTLLGVLAVAFLGMQQLIGSRAPPVGPGMVSPTAYAHGTLSDRFGDTSFDEVVNRLMYQVHGITSVLKHPAIGPTQVEYAREVVGSGGMVISSAQAEEILAPHNHYINAGVRAGVPGWLALAGCLWALWKAQRTVKAATRPAQAALRTEYLCVSVGLAAVMANAIFHNAGIFTPELATTSMVGLLLALYRQVMREPPRRPPAVPAAEEETVEEPLAGPRGIA